MCGILGCFTLQPISDYENRMNASIDALRHRGPDEQNLEQYQVAGGTLVFGHTRLSIIDLSPGGRQPKHSDDGRFSLIFNGEIYNYKELRHDLESQGMVFHTNSDTEVLLACWKLWGADCLPKLRGMFAFLMLDRQNKTLTCVRDAFGIKPLFYHLDNGSLVIASELPALLKLIPRKPRLNHQQAIEYLLNDRYDTDEKTFFEGISQLPPGYLIEIHLDELSQSSKEGEHPPPQRAKRWWYPNIEERIDLTFDQAAERLREMFLENIRLHLRSDVPLGAALSGGIDSSAVVCAIRKQEPEIPIQTFSFIARGSTVNEESWVDLVNSQVGAISHKVVIEPGDIVSDLDDLIFAQGEPFGGTSIYAQYRVFKLAKENGIIVTLDGQGADELLAGYHGYHDARMLSMIERREFGKLSEFVHGWSQWPGRSLGYSVRTALRQILPTGVQRFEQKLRQNPALDWINLKELEYFGFQNPAPQNGTGSWSRQPEAHGRRLAESLRAALTGNGLGALLRHGDRNSMRWSIESRVPFLTNDMAEFLLSMPENYLVSDKGETKYIFRKAMRGIVPDTVLDRKDKIGFATPEGSWLRVVGDKIINWTQSAERVRFLRPEPMRKSIRRVLDGQAPFTQHTWRFLNFCCWLDLFDPIMD
jgi:asparagine synthase (glutamine-hydrolysing)